MVKINRILIFDKRDGTLIHNSGTMRFGIREKTDQELYDNFPNISNEHIHIYRCCEYEFDQEIYDGGIPIYNSETDEIIWEYTQKTQESLDRLTELENAVAELALLSLEVLNNG